MGRKKRKYSCDTNVINAEQAEVLNQEASRSTERVVDAEINRKPDLQAPQQSHFLDIQDSLVSTTWALDTSTSADVEKDTTLRTVIDQSDRGSIHCEEKNPTFGLVPYGIDTDSDEDLPLSIVPPTSLTDTCTSSGNLGRIKANCDKSIKDEPNAPEGMNKVSEKEEISIVDNQLTNNIDHRFSVVAESILTEKTGSVKEEDSLSCHLIEMETAIKTESSIKTEMFGGLSERSVKTEDEVIEEILPDLSKVKTKENLDLVEFEDQPHEKILMEYLSKSLESSASEVISHPAVLEILPELNEEKVKEKNSENLNPVELEDQPDEKILMEHFSII